MNQEVRALIKALVDQGFDVDTSNGGHIKVYRGGKYVATLPKTPSDFRSLRNAISVLRREAGFQPKQKRHKPKRKR